MLARIILFSFCLCLLPVAEAQVLSQPQIFNRCYTQLTGRAVPLNHATMKLVKAGTMTAQAACESLLDKTELTTGSGMLTASTDPEAALVLNNFYTFHRTWFPGNTVEQAVGLNGENGFGTRDIYDATEPGLAITKAVFMQGAKYSDVLTDSTGVHGIRRDDPAVVARTGLNIPLVSRGIVGNNMNYNLNVFNFSSLTLPYSGQSSNAIIAALPKIEVGELVGIRPTTESAMVPNVALSYLDPSGERKGNTIPGLNYNFNLFQTQGGGVLGTPIYLMMNFGHPLGLTMNGSLKLPRRWSQVNMTTFMCATLPALREADVRKFVVGNSSAPFRNASSCVMCHANLDQMAYTARNAVIADTDYFVISDVNDANAGIAKIAFLMTSFRPEMPSVAGWPSEPVVDFPRQSPSGRLYFRSVTGQLVDQPVTGIAGLGAAMTQTDDYYQCAAKRYFGYMTGIQVALYDRQDPRYVDTNRQLSPEAIADRLYIEKLASDLRQSQSIKKMIKSIMSSDYYRSAKFRP